MRTLRASTVTGQNYIRAALADYDRIEQCTLRGAGGEIELPPGTSCHLVRCAIDDITIKTNRPELIVLEDCNFINASIRRSGFFPPNGCWMLRQFADDLARVQLMGGGTVKTVTFEGPGAVDRATEYQAWANEKLAATVCPTKEEAKEPPSWSRSGPAREIDISRRRKTPMVALVEELENVALIPVIESKEKLDDARLADAAISLIVQYRGQQVCVCRKCKNSPCSCRPVGDGVTDDTDAIRRGGI